MKNAMKFAKMLINWMIWFMGIDLIVRLGWTYNDPVTAGMVWIGLVGLKSALGALGCVGLAVVFGGVAGCGLGCLLFVVRIFERIGNLIMGVW